MLTGIKIRVQFDRQTHIIIVHCTECPADFTYVSSVNGCYKVVNRNLAWTAAGLECRSLHKDAHLLIINDAVEQSAIAEMLASIDGPCKRSPSSSGFTAWCYAERGYATVSRLSLCPSVRLAVTFRYRDHVGWNTVIITPRLNSLMYTCSDWLQRGRSGPTGRNWKLWWNRGGARSTRTPVLRDTLHWLPVTARIQFKVAALTFDCIRGTGPVYLKQLICPVSDLSRRSLRSAGRGDLLGQRSFSIAVPMVWNALPPDIRSLHNSRQQFRSKLKTYLFRQTYTAWLLWEQIFFVEECNSVTVTVTVRNCNITGTVQDRTKVTMTD